MNPGYAMNDFMTAPYLMTELHKNAATQERPLVHPPLVTGRWGTIRYDFVI